MLQSSTFKVNIRFSNVASELLIWVSQTASHVPCGVVVCLYVNMHVYVCCGHVVTWSRGHGQDQVEKQWWALRFGPGASGFIIDSALLEQHHHAAEPTSQAYESFLLVASKRDATVQSLANVLNRYAAGSQRAFAR